MIPIIAITQALKNKYVIVASAFAFICATFYVYYSYASNKIERIETENSTLSKTIEQKEEYIQNLKIDYDKIIKSKDELSATIKKSNALIFNLRTQLERDRVGKKSIEELALAKPILVQNYINKRIKKQLDCFKLIDLNGECP